MSSGAITEFGFDWGPMSVTRCCELPGHYVLQVKTEHQTIDVYVSKAGRKIRVFDRLGTRDQRELKRSDVLLEHSTEEEGR